jgi:hypothetical protein
VPAICYNSPIYDSVPTDIPLEIRAVADRLRSAGYEAYLVGGCVRDLLLGRTQKTGIYNRCRTRRDYGYISLIVFVIMTTGLWGKD